MNYHGGKLKRLIDISTILTFNHSRQYFSSCINKHSNMIPHGIH